ncbi:hypothetical protein B0J18DRAFT_407379 [Chaetomium sp. MPI-SDFR-AT-0129]|nr:hypothetical protein B0J18DRAFT_407379 [Chaetomium sp. MPI-SDFR-AT-0129]
MIQAPPLRPGYGWDWPRRWDEGPDPVRARKCLGRAPSRALLEFVAVTGWSHQPPPNGRSSYGHHRSLSSILRTASPRPSSTHARSNSTTELPMVGDGFLRSSRPSTPQPKRLFVPSHPDDFDNDMSTIPDPRSRAMSPASGEVLMSSPAHHPDLNDEVATLSTKLINAINHQTALDDNLSATRVELERSQDRIRELEAEVEDQREMLSGDVWVRRKTVEAEKAMLVARAAEEKRARLDMEQQKKKIEQELENLTAALFEEANKMVISAKEDARAEQEALQRKNDQLRAQIADTEALLRSQQEQLVELKQVMEQMAVEKEEQQSPATVPSSPGRESVADARESVGFGPMVVGPSRHHSFPVPSPPPQPSYPTSFTHLLHPVLRTDLAACNDFKELLRTTKRLSAPRLPSGSSGSGLASLGIGLGSATSHISMGSVSTTSLATTTGTPPTTSPQTPHTPASSVSSTTSANTHTTPLPHLKETKFYKRVLTEDIEPTLRLDTAPGLSWLARRSVLTAMTDGSLVVEPTPSTATGRFGKVIKPELHPCSLCGEARKDAEHLLRTHRFRVSETDNTTQVGYPLCRYCLGRVRSTCEFLGFLRIVKDGHWRFAVAGDDEDAEWKAAWEESVRLREQMFWSRMGGGVVPVGGHGRQFSGSESMLSIRGERSPRPSQEGGRPVLKQPVELTESPKETPKETSKGETEAPREISSGETSKEETPKGVVEMAQQAAAAEEAHKESLAPEEPSALDPSAPKEVGDASSTPSTKEAEQPVEQPAERPTESLSGQPTELTEQPTEPAQHVAQEGEPTPPAAPTEQPTEQPSEPTEQQQQPTESTPKVDETKAPLFAPISITF